MECPEIRHLAHPVSASTDQMPRRQPQGRSAQSIGHPCIAAMMNLPAPPEGEDGSHNHQDSAHRIQSNFSTLFKSFASDLRPDENLRQANILFAEGTIGFDPDGAQSLSLVGYSMIVRGMLP